MKSDKSNPINWDTFWKKQKITPGFILNKKNSSVYKLLESLIMEKFKSIEELEIIEIGSGIGVNSLLLAQNGAKVTLIDFSEVALRKAREIYNFFGLEPKIIKADILNLDERLYGKFDLAMSFGLAEHFSGEDRKMIFKIHYQLIRNDGLLIVSVPNKNCISYQFWMNSLKIIDKWNAGYEKPFTKKELLQLSKIIGIRNFKIIGVNFLKSISDHGLFVFTYPLARMSQESKNGLRMTLIPDIRLPILDNWIGYALWLIGMK